ncbi:MAG TPA: helix-turn-helix domain-containing protein [Acidimicrobiia bacterium]|nr:helix-turn-helix domain-containing protein [Acidimicrobiia bacterium]
MPRRSAHSERALLDAARHVVVRDGVRFATVAAIADASGAPVGSIYHRFASLDELLARAWLRAASASQAAIPPAGPGSDRTDAVDDAAAIAGSMYDFCLEHPDDAALLRSLRPNDIDMTRVSPAIADALAAANDPALARLGDLARRLFGRRSDASQDLLLLLLVDVPYAFALRSGRQATSRARYRDGLDAAVRAALSVAGPPARR